MGMMKTLATDAQEYFDRLKYAQQSPMTREELAKFESEYALLKVRFSSLGEESRLDNPAEGAYE